MQKQQLEARFVLPPGDAESGLAFGLLVKRKDAPNPLTGRIGTLVDGHDRCSTLGFAVNNVGRSDATMPNEFYGEKEAEEILRLAARNSESGAMTRERLIATAAEVGISPEAVLEAERQVRSQREEQTNLAEFKAYRKRKFTEEVLSFFGTNAFLIGIWFFTGAGFFWPGFVLFFWTWGFFDDMVAYFVPGSASYRKSYDRWLRKKQKEEQRRLEAAAD